MHLRVAPCFLRAVGLGVLMTTFGCGTAVIKLRSGRQLAGVIVKGEPEHVVVKLTPAQTVKAFRDTKESAAKPLDEPPALESWNRPAWASRWERWFERNPHADLKPASVDDPMAGTFKIRRRVISDVEHPGYYAGVTGTVLAGVAVPMIIGGVAWANSCPTDAGYTGCTFLPSVLVILGAGSAIAGIATMIPGWVMYSSSKSAMASGATAMRPAVDIMPLATAVDGKLAIGLATRGSW